MPTLYSRAGSSGALYEVKQAEWQVRQLTEEGSHAAEACAADGYDVYYTAATGGIYRYDKAFGTAERVVDTVYSDDASGSATPSLHGIQRSNS